MNAGLLEIAEILLKFEVEKTVAAGAIRQDTPAATAKHQPTEAGQRVNNTPGQRIVKKGD